MSARLTFSVGPKDRDMASGYYAVTAWPTASRMFLSEPTLERNGMKWIGPFPTLQQAMDAATIEEEA